MKRLSAYLAMALLLFSCSYEPLQTHKATSVGINILDVGGIQAVINYKPEDDRTYYLQTVLTKEEYDSLHNVYGNAKDAINSTLVEMYKDYSVNIKKKYTLMGNKYIAPFKSTELYYGEITDYYVDLYPETDYYAIAYCVDCVNDSTFTLLGDLYKVPFTTTKIDTARTKLCLDFMVRDYGERCYYYSRPTYSDSGKLCRLPYLLAIISDTTLKEEYDGDIFAFVRVYYASMAITDVTKANIHTDVCRTECTEMMTEGEGYTIVGIPYCLDGLYHVFTNHFEYEEGISTEYTHTELEDELE